MAVVSLRENEKRAAGVALLMSLAAALPFVLIGVLDIPDKNVIGVALLILAGLKIGAFSFPTGRPASAVGDDTPRGRIDERDVMFSRKLLEPGTERFETYYNEKPGLKPLDDKFRAKPGLMAKGSRYYDPVTFEAAHASFTTVKNLHSIVDGEPSGDRVDVDDADITHFIKEWALQTGAVSVGVTELRDYHKYSVIGRGPDFGKTVTLDHKYAIAFTVEMNKEMIDAAPLGPTLMESAQQYLESGMIATQIAVFIRNLGYPARAHIDANYRVVCPLVARDAALGEIGRMGLLMTPELGPRVRISVVTTDLPLVIDEPRRDYTTLDFCTHCRKCADVCPSRAISFEKRVEIDGVLRWQIDQEACYTYWSAAGTDCARCVKVCPYSHPDNLLHNLVRRGVKNSSLFRRMAIYFDDLFYGEKPRPADPPGWTKVDSGDISDFKS